MIQLPWLSCTCRSNTKHENQRRPRAADVGRRRKKPSLWDFGGFFCMLICMVIPTTNHNPKTLCCWIKNIVHTILFVRDSARSVATVAYLKRCHLCFICPELKPIKLRRAQQSVTERRGHPGLAGTLAALSFSSFSPGPALRASCESGQPVRDRDIWDASDPWMRRESGVGGQLEGIRGRELGTSCPDVCVGSDPSGTLNWSTVPHGNDAQVWGTGAPIRSFAVACC